MSPITITLSCCDGWTDSDERDKICIRHNRGSFINSIGKTPKELSIHSIARVTLFSAQHNIHLKSRFPSIRSLQ